MDRIQRAAVAVACLTLSMIFLALAIDAVGEVPTLREVYAPETPSQDDALPRPSQDAVRMDHIVSDERAEPVLRIYGATETSYLRLVPYDNYYNGAWETSLGASTPYEGGYVDIPADMLASVDPITFTVYPLTDLGKYLPTAQNTVSMNLTSLVNYMTEGQVFTTGAEPQAYSLTYFKFSLSEEQLRDAALVYDPKYLEVPHYLEEDLRALSVEITAGDSTPYDQLVSLRDYLIERYKYNMSYASPPLGVDPLEFFLFESGEGVCTHFNTALTMMARVLGIPARLVGGFYIDPHALVQDVYPIQRHAFTEVPFKGLGWITFDATPGSEISSIIDSLPKYNASNGGIDDDTPTVVVEPLEPPRSTSEGEVFKIYGITGTKYLRNGVAEYYNGSWYLSSSTAQGYTGSYIERTLDECERVDSYHFYVEYGEPIQGFIPCPQYTRQLMAEAALEYYPKQDLFRVSNGGVAEYEVLSEAPSFSEASLIVAEPCPDELYLQIPEALNATIRPIALQASRSQARMYGKVKAIEEYLKTHYAYDLTTEQAPAGIDPVEWFLLHEKQGICTDFNSALVLMARSLGIPARLVTGYLINARAEVQIVRACQAHAYAEVLFDGLGWVVFDAAPVETGETPESSGLVPTFTNVTYQDEYVLVGSRFAVAGTVEDEVGHPVSGLSVMVYLKQEKSASGVLAGKAEVLSGHFNVSCLFPSGLPPGEYMVDAHTVGNEHYLGSWSDPPIVVYTETVFLVESPIKVQAGKNFELTGVLLNKPTNKSIGGAVCSVEVNGRVLRGTTGSDGRISFEVSLDQPGEYPVRFSWEGERYYLGASTVKSVRSLPLGFALKDTAVVRGETSAISGAVQADEIPGAYEAITARIMGNEVSTSTDERGCFTLMCKVPRDHELGSLPISLFLHSSQLTVASAINVYARPRLSVAAGGSIQAGQRRDVIVLLVDDHGSPLPSMAVEAKYTQDDETRSYSLVTGPDGEAVFNMLARSDDASTIIYEARFQGSGDYLAAQTTGNVPITPAPAFPLLPALAALLAALGLGGLLTLQRRWSEQETQEAHGTVAENEINKGITILFTQIIPPLPDVWGVGEELDLSVSLLTAEGSPITGAKITLVTQEDAVLMLSDADGLAHTWVQFADKGVYDFSAEYTAGRLEAKRQIRVVEYREEIIGLFNSKFKEAEQQFKALRGNHTARELLEHFMKGAPPRAQDALSEMVHLFEEANYSLHPVGRRLFEQFYMAMKGYEEASRGE